MKKLLQSKAFAMVFLASLFFPNLQLSAQDTAVIFNNIKAQINSRKSFFLNTKYNGPGFEIPYGSGKYSIYTANWWLAADLPDSSHVVAAETFGSIHQDFVSGPKSNNYDSIYKKRWERVWVINKSDICYHLNHFRSSDYVLPASIGQWPAHGDTLSGEPWLVAPFVDTDGNGIYEPLNGDYPSIHGDVAAFVIRNDAGAPKTETGSPPMGIQESLMFYSYDTTEVALRNTIFLNTTFTNIGSNTLNDIKIGMWSDFDIGNSEDDYVGTDSLRHTIYVYNGDTLDENGPYPGYGETPPCQAYTFLNTDMDNSFYYNITGTGPPAQQEPTVAAHYYSYLHSRLKDNSPFLHRYCFGGNPDGSAGISETSEGNVPGDRRVIGVSSAGTLLPGQSVMIVGAYVYSRAESGNNLASVEKMKVDVSAVRRFYYKNNETPCEIETGIQQISGDQQFKIFPNPANHQFTIELPQELGLNSVSLYNSLGQKVLQTKQTAISVDGLPAGIYTVRINTTKGNFSQLLVLQ